MINELASHGQAMPAVYSFALSFRESELTMCALHVQAAYNLKHQQSKETGGKSSIYFDS